MNDGYYTIVLYSIGKDYRAIGFSHITLRNTIFLPCGEDVYTMKCCR